VVLVVLVTVLVPLSLVTMVACVSIIIIGFNCWRRSNARGGMVNYTFYHDEDEGL